MSNFVYHKACFKCSVCKRSLDTVTCEIVGAGTLYCKGHIPKDKPVGSADSIEMTRVKSAEGLRAGASFNRLAGTDKPQGQGILSMAEQSQSAAQKQTGAALKGDKAGTDRPLGQGVLTMAETSQSAAQKGHGGALKGDKAGTDRPLGQGVLNMAEANAVNAPRQGAIAASHAGTERPLGQGVLSMGDNSAMNAPKVGVMQSSNIKSEESGNYTVPGY